MLVAGNAVMLLPQHWTFIHFCPMPVSTGQLTLERGAGQGVSVVVDYPDCVLVLDPPWMTPRLPSPIQEYIERRRFMSIVESSQLEITIAGVDPESPQHHPANAGWAAEPGMRMLKKTFAANDVYAPKAESPLRFELRDIAILSPGEYTVHARLVFPTDLTPYRIPSLSSPQWSEQGHRRLMAPFSPGAVLLHEAATNPLALIVGDE